MRFSYVSKGIILMLIGILVFAQTGFSQNAEEIEGFITSIDQKENRVQINQQWFILSAEAAIIRNGQSVGLSACVPIDGSRQWGKGVLVNGELQQLVVNYQVLEGVVKQVNSVEGWLEVNVFHSPETEGGTIRFYLKDSPLDLNLSKFESRDYIAAAVADDKLLYVELIK